MRSLAGGGVKGVEWLFKLPKLIEEQSVSWSHDPRALKVITEVTKFATVASPPSVSPLHLAVDGVDDNEGVFRAYGSLPVFTCILKHFQTSEQLDWKDKDGLTALHYAAWLGKFEETRLLVEAGASINANTGRYGTPLDMTFIGRPRYYVENELGPTREMVKRFVRGRNDVAVYLRQHGALALQEIQTGTKLGDWVPFPLGVDANFDHRPLMPWAVMRRLNCRMYGCRVEIPKFNRAGTFSGKLRARELQSPSGGVERDRTQIQGAE